MPFPRGDVSVSLPPGFESLSDAPHFTRLSVANALISPAAGKKSLGAWVAVDRGHEFVHRVDAVDGLAQVQAQVLANAAAVAPDVGDARGPGHDRDADARPKPIHTRENRIFSNESYCPPVSSGDSPRSRRTERKCALMSKPVDTVGATILWLLMLVPSTVDAAVAVNAPTIARYGPHVIGADDSAESGSMSRGTPAAEPKPFEPARRTRADRLRLRTVLATALKIGPFLANPPPSICRPESVRMSAAAGDDSIEHLGVDVASNIANCDTPTSRVTTSAKS